ncbi:Uncharacterised protein [Bordetella pertussis]|nr:Uncharacterised protein [Bordetella pertussis]CFW33230.1 Uncharacterised protein [Bordetella pertussis]
MDKATAASASQTSPGPACVSTSVAATQPMVLV